MNKFLILLLVVLAATVSSLEQSQSRLFKERVRVQSTEPPTHSDEHHDEDVMLIPMAPKKNDKVLGSMDTIGSIARVQRDQAHTFRLWSEQFELFKISVMKFMTETSDVLQQHDKQIRTLQRVAKKIAKDMEE